MYRIPIQKIMLVKEGYQNSEVKTINSPTDVYTLIKSYMEGLDRENFVVLMLDTKNKVTGINTVSVGSLNSSMVHPREVFKPAILSNSNSIILVHNHPSGNPAPSKEDIAVTERLKQAGELLGIEVLDHIIVGDNMVSLKEQGVI